MLVRARSVALRPGLALCLLLAGAQAIDDTTAAPIPVPPPLPRPAPPKSAGGYEPVLAESDAPWGLAPELARSLHARADDYAAFARRFTCDEMARLADYDSSGAAAREKTRRYGYLLVKADVGIAIREYRQEMARDGTLKSGEVADEEPFPPAYMWVFLFSRLNDPYISYRYITDRFDGFDWVHEIQFRGSLPFSDGKDIREWEGTALIDAVTFTPVEIRAEPAGQFDRIRELYRRYQQSFNLVGARLAPKPLGYRAQVQFRHRNLESGLSFPTELRYDTFQAVTSSRVVPVRASTRTYANYKVFKVTEEERVETP